MRKAFVKISYLYMYVILCTITSHSTKYISNPLHLVNRWKVDWICKNGIYYYVINAVTVLSSDLIFRDFFLLQDSFECKWCTTLKLVVVVVFSYVCLTTKWVFDQSWRSFRIAFTLCISQQIPNFSTLSKWRKTLNNLL